MLQTSQTLLETPSHVQRTSSKVNVIMPHGMFGFQAINHYTIAPLLPDKEEWVYWRLTARDFLDEDCGTAAYENSLNPKPEALSFILLALGDLNVGGITIRREDVDFCLKSLGIPYEECIVFLVISIETDDKGQLVNMTTNVKAPVVFHSITKQAWQIILPEEAGCSYPISLPLMGG